VIDIDVIQSAQGGAGLQEFFERIFPVLLGAAMSFAATWIFVLRAERDRKLTDAYALIYGAHAAVESIIALNKVLTATIHRVKDEGVARWQAVAIPTGFDWGARCQLNQNAVALLSVKGKFKLVDQLLELSRIHDVLHIMTADFAGRQEALLNRYREIASDAVAQDGKVTWSISDGDLKKLRPDTMRVEDLVGQILE